ncbi:MAG: PAS domain S-box protein [Candidatus Omnitrophota bacterium]
MSSEKSEKIIKSDGARVSLVSDPRLVLWFCVVGIVLILGGFFYYTSERNHIRQVKASELSAIGKMKVEQIVRWRRERSSDATRIANSPLSQKLVGEWLRDPDRLLNKQELTDRLKLEVGQGIYFQALLVTADQKILLSGTSESAEMETDSWAAVKKALTEPGPVLSDLHFTSSGKIHIDIATAVRNPAGQLLAVLVLTTNAEEFLFPMIQFWPTSSQSGETLLVRRDGDEVLFLNELRHKKGTALELRFPLSLTTLPATQAVLGKTGIFHGKDYLGVPVIADLRPVPGTAWFVVAKESESEIQGEVRFRAIIVSGAVFILILCLAGGMAFWNQTLQVEERKQAENRLRRSAKEWGDTFDAISDAVWLLSPDSKILRSNKAAELVFNLKVEDLVGRYCYEVVHGTDKPHPECPIARMRVSGHRESSELLLDGHWFSVTVDPIIDPAGSLMGIVHVVSDINQRKRMEATNALNVQRTQALLKLNQLTEASLKEITDFALEAAVQLTQSKIGYLAFLNPDESVLTMHAWSKSAMAECAISDKPILYDVKATGLWGEAVRQRRAVITNDYAAANPLKKGCPQGHVMVKRHMNAPVFDGSRIVIVAGVGNKDEEYTEGDVYQLTLLMEGMWRLIERKRLEGELAQAKESQFKTLMETLPSKVFIKDKNSVYVACNESFANDLGIKEEELAGKTDYDLFPTHQAKKNREDDKRIIESGKAESREEEYQLIHDYLKGSQKSYVDIVKAPIRDSRGNVTGILGFFWDITARKEAEMSMRKNRELLFEMTSQVPGVVFQFYARPNGERGLYFVSPKVEQIFGFKSELEAFFEKFTAFVIPEDREGFLKSIERSVQEVSEWKFEGMFEKPSGERISFSGNSIPFLSKNEIVFNGILLDTSERKKTEMEKKRVESLASVAETKSRFTSMVSHELRSPLAVTKEALDILLEGMAGSVSDGQKEILRIAKGNVDRLGRLINNVLDFQKIESGKMAYDIRGNDLNEVLSEVHQSMSVLSKKKGLDLQVELEKGLPETRFDRDRIVQVLTNLMSNAINNTEQGSVILAAKKENNGVHVRVQDAGIGIPAEDIQKLFQPFEQVDGNRAKKRGGTGLGLAISKEIILAHHGKIWAESEVGKGSVFHFTLPL